MRTIPRIDSVLKQILVLACLLFASAAIADPGKFKPRTYVLVSAIGSDFYVTIEYKGTGTRLPPYRVQRLEGAGESFNHMVLSGLEQQVAAREPDSVRLLMIHPGDESKRSAPSLRARANLDAVLAQLKGHPGRSTWDRIIVVTPAYRAQKKDDMATGLHGMGLFIQPECESDVESCLQNAIPPNGPTAIRPDGSKTYTNHFFAPYFYITVWELDAATFEVLEKLEVFEQTRMVGPDRGISVFDKSDSPQVAQQIGKMVSETLQEALRKTAPAGKVEVKVLKE